jgi:hypothetical protein
MKHSPLPWKVEKFRDNFCSEDVWRIVDAKGNIVFNCNFVDYEGGGEPPSEEDTKFILWAVNIYAERLESFERK